MRVIYFLSLIFLFNACSILFPEVINEEEQLEEETGTLALVTETKWTGEENNYTFSVTIKSPDTGCQQYADWWEIIDLEGNLIYRRILGHSHVNEQPFTRSGGPVKITSEEIVYIRSHMNNNSFGSEVMKGSTSQGYETAVLAIDFAKDLEQEQPLPINCAF